MSDVHDGAALGSISRRVFWALVLVCLALRIWLATLPGYVVDVGLYKEWAAWTALNGLSAAYESESVDYPPLILYPLCAVGHVYLSVEPEVAPGKVRDSSLLTFLVKSPNIFYDLGLAALLFWVVGRGGTWGESRAGPGWGRLAALLYLWNPAVLWDSGYWGQPDGAHSALIVAAVAALAVDRTAASGALLAAAGLMKPLAAPLVPLVAWTAAARRGLVGIATTAAGGVAVAVLIFAPFIVTGRVIEVLRRVVGDVGAMPYTSVNGHNLWWILGPWRDADVPVVGFVTSSQIGLALFLTAYLVLMLRVHGRLRDGDRGPRGSGRTSS